MQSTESYFNGNELAISTFNRKYALQKGERKEYPEEAVRRVVRPLLKFEPNTKIGDTWLDTWMNGYWRFGGSIFTIGNKETPKQSTANCTTTTVEDDTLESIFKTAYEIAKCAAYRQGVGVDISALRPRGSKLKNSAKTSDGSVHWLDFMSTLANYVGQNARRPALLGSMSILHPDILEFISAKDNLDKLTNMNISVQIPNAFMSAAMNDRSVPLNFGDKVYKAVNAMELLKLIAEHAYNFGEPGIQFISLMKQHSMQEAVGFPIVGTNACSEKPLPRNGVCNLCSINLGTMPIGNWQHHLGTLIPPIVRFMDDVTSYEIAYDKSPIPEQKHTVKSLREIGIGVTNPHEWLLKHNTAYGSTKGNRMFEDVASYISKLVWTESERLAQERGSFPAYDAKKLQTSKFYQHMCREVGTPKGLRFAANMSIAPAGSISLILPHYVSQGIEPAIGFAYWRKTRISNKNYDHYFVLTNTLKQAILQNVDNEYEYNFIDNLGYSTLDNAGEIGTIVQNIIGKYDLDKVYKGAHDIAIEDKLDLLARIQPWVDAGISTTFNLPQDSEAYTLPTFICNAWQKGIKCLSIYRTGSRDDILTFTPPKKHSTKDDGLRPVEITPTFAPKRPKELPCDIHKVVVKGQQYVALIGLMEGKPYEIFAGKVDNINIPTTVKTGALVRRKSRTYDLVIKTERIDKVISDIAHTFMNEEHGAFTRSLSRELRHGIPIYFIADGLKKSEGNITDFSKVVARVLSKYNGHIPSFAQKQHICPTCHTPLTVEGGCEHCLTCGFSKCD